MGCRYRRHRKFRDMRVLRHQPSHTAQAEARVETVNEMRKRSRMIGRGKPGLRRVTTLCRKRDESHHVVAKTGIAFVADGVKPFDKQRADARGVAQGCAGAGTDAVHLAVGAEQRGLDPSCSFAAPLQAAA